MVSTRKSAQQALNGNANGHIQAGANAIDVEHTDPTRWRLLDESGRHTWHYLEDDEEAEEWPQTIADKYELGLPTVLLLVIALNIGLY